MASAALQVATSAVVLILVYRYVNATVGLDRFGVWSGVMAVTALANLGECGLGGAALRFVARSQALGQQARTPLVIETTVLSGVAIAGATAGAVWPLGWAVLAVVFAGQSPLYLAEARGVLPMALLVPVLGATSNVVLSSLDGLERVHERTLIAFAASMSLAVGVGVLVPRYGLTGLALAQVVQNATGVLLGWARLHRHVEGLSVIPRRWVRPMAAQGIRFGLGWQAVGWAGLLMDPLAKVLAIRFGGVAFAGHFEFVLRVAPQVRSIVSSAQQALMPLLTRLSARGDDRLTFLYAASMRATLGLVLLAQPFLFASAPLVAWVWMSGAEAEVAPLLRLVLMVGFVNLLGNPAYFESAGRGDLRPNIAAHLAMALLNAALGWFLGHMWGGPGVALGYALALAGGALLLAAWHGRRHRVRVSAWLGRTEVGFAVVALLSTVAVEVSLRSSRPIAYTVACLAAAGLVSAALAWKHPLHHTLRA